MAPVRRRSRRAAGAMGAALMVAGAVVLTTATPARAADAPVSAFWARTSLSSGMAATPDGHLRVEQAFDGPAAVAAISVDVPAAAEEVVLVLTVGDGSSVTETSALLSCAAASPWEPSEDGGAGAWADRPRHDPNNCAPGEVAADLGSIRFDVTALASGGLDLVVMPAPAEDGFALEERFVLFVPTPDASALAVEIEDEAPPPAVSPPTTVAAAAGPSVASTPERTPSPVVPAPPFAAPPVERPVAVDPPPPPAPSPVEDVSAPVIPAQSLEVAGPALPIPPLVPGVVNDDPLRRIFAIALLLAGAATAVWAKMSNDPETAAIGLGRFRVALPAGGGAAVAAGLPGPAHAPAPPSSDAVGGLGRFARVRSSAPTPLM